jgi:hypothetical protein
VSAFRARSQPGPSAIADFVSRLAPGPRGALLSLRALVLSLGPDVVERVESGIVEYLRRDRPFLLVEAVRSRLVAAFPAGTDVADPMGRLLRRADQRYFRLDGAADFDAHVQEFVRKAYAAARV